MENKIRIAVFPVAGYGTRFLPVTKASPKEILPIVDKPIIQYAVEEAIIAGFTQLIFITNHGKSAIEDYFDVNLGLEAHLRAKHAYDLLKVERETLVDGISYVFVRQHRQLGLGHAVLCSQGIVGNEPFAVVLADDLITTGRKNCLQELLEVYEKEKHSVLAVMEVDKADVTKYGIVKLDANDSNKVVAVVEKPACENAPSNLAIVGRYIFTAKIFRYLRETKPGMNGEIQLTDAIADMLAKEKINICKFSGKRYDCGNKLEYIKAVVDYALANPELKEPFKEFLENIKTNKEN